MRQDLRAAGLASMLALAMTVTATFGVPIAQAAAESGKDDLAAELRAQGFACGKAEHAVRNAKLSQPNETVWDVTCDNGSYRMRVVPDMGAKIKRLKK